MALLTLSKYSYLCFFCYLCYIQEHLSNLTIKHPHSIPIQSERTFFFRVHLLDQKKKTFNSHQLYYYKCENAHFQQQSSKQILTIPVLGHKCFKRAVVLFFIGAFKKDGVLWVLEWGEWVELFLQLTDILFFFLVLGTVKAEMGRNSKFTILI